MSDPGPRRVRVYEFHLPLVEDQITGDWWPLWLATKGPKDDWEFINHTVVLLFNSLIWLNVSTWLDFDSRGRPVHRIMPDAATLAWMKLLNERGA